LKNSLYNLSILEFSDTLDRSNSVKDQDNALLERTKDHLNRRYSDTRGGDYKVRQAENEGRTLRPCFLRTKRYRKEHPVERMLGFREKRIYLTEFLEEEILSTE